MFDFNWWFKVLHEKNTTVLYIRRRNYWRFFFKFIFGIECDCPWLFTVIANEIYSLYCTEIKTATEKNLLKFCLFGVTWLRPSWFYIITEELYGMWSMFLNIFDCRTPFPCNLYNLHIYRIKIYSIWYTYDIDTERSLERMNLIMRMRMMILKVDNPNGRRKTRAAVIYYSITNLILYTYGTEFGN